MEIIFFNLVCLDVFITNIILTNLMSGRGREFCCGNSNSGGAINQDGPSGLAHLPSGLCSRMG